MWPLEKSQDRRFYLKVHIYRHYKVTYLKKIWIKFIKSASILWPTAFYHLPTVTGSHVEEKPDLGIVVFEWEIKTGTLAQKRWVWLKFALLMRTTRLDKNARLINSV